MFGPFLLVIPINYFNENLQGTMSKFADDIKVGDIVDSEDGYQELQWKLISWASGI